MPPPPRVATTSPGITTAPNPENLRYLKTKAEKMGHLLEGLEDLPPDAAGAISPESADDVEAQSEADPRGR